MRHHPSLAALGTGRQNRAAWVLAMGVVDFSLEQTILIPALPAMVTQFHTDITGVTWLVTSFLVASAVSTPLAGRLGDRFGRRRALLVSLAAFALGSLVCAVGRSVGVLIAGRVVQGLGAGVGPLATALLPDAVAPERLSRAIGLLIGAGGLGGVVGLLAAGPLVDHLSVSSIFWLLVIVAVGLMIAVALWVPESNVRSPVRIDWIGAVLLSTFLASLMLAISQGNAWGWRSFATVVLLVGSVLLLALFVVDLRLTPDPLLDTRSLSRPAALGANLAVLVVGLALFGAYVLVPQIAGLPSSTGYGLGLTTTETGLLLTPGSVGALLGGVLGGRLISRVGARAQTIVGVACAVVTYAVLALLPNNAAVMSLALVPLGFGIGVALVAIVELIVRSVPGDQTGVAVGLNSVLRAIGAAIGSQVVVAVLLASPRLSPGVPVHGGFRRAFLVGLGASVVAVAVMAIVPRQADQPTSAVTQGA
jgi:EmrB/QacA subfamily drug resistance transporter